MKKEIEEICNKLNREQLSVFEATNELLNLFSVMCSAGDEVRENGTNIWYKVKKIDGRNIYLDYDDGLNCLGIQDIIEIKHCT